MRKGYINIEKNRKEFDKYFAENKKVGKIMDAIEKDCPGISRLMFFYSEGGNCHGVMTDYFFSHGIPERKKVDLDKEVYYEKIKDYPENISHIKSIDKEFTAFKQHIKELQEIMLAAYK